MGKNDKKDISLYYEEYGAGEPILFIHGLGTNTYSWRYLAPPLSKRYKVILVDLKGFGKSPKPQDENYSIYEHARIINHFIETHDLQKLTIVGHSLGGTISLVLSIYLAENNSHLLKRLVLLDTAAYEQRVPLFVKILSTPLVRDIIISIIPNKLQVRSIYNISFYDKDKISEEAVNEYASSLGNLGVRHALIQTASQLIPNDMGELTNKYKLINIPTLLIWGRQDEITPLTVGEKLERAINNSKLSIIEECGHIPQEEKPIETLKIIENFLESTPID